MPNSFTPATQAKPSQLASSQHYITDAVMHACGLEGSSRTHSPFRAFRATKATSRPDASGYKRGMKRESGSIAIRAPFFDCFL